MLFWKWDAGMAMDGGGIGPEWESENKREQVHFSLVSVCCDETAFIDESNNGNPTRELKPGLHLVIKRYKAWF